MEIAIVVAYIALLIFLVNDAEPNMLLINWLMSLFPLALFFVGLNAIIYAISESRGLLEGVFWAGMTWGTLIICVVMIFSYPARLQLKRLLGQNTGYRPDSVVHTLAFVLLVAQLGSTLGSSYASGGLTGMAERMNAQQSFNPNALLMDMGIFILFALGGVGFFMRRNFSQTMERLALRLPTRIDLVGIGVGVLVYIAVMLGVVLWQFMVSPEAFEAQTQAVDAMGRLYGAQWTSGLLLAFTSSVGEEVLYRGALQPIFGIPTTTLFFVLAHTQYGFTPATLIIAGVALSFAFLRHKYSTTTAIVAHFVYNAIPFILTASLGGVAIP